MAPMSTSAGESLDGRKYVTFLDGENDTLTFEDGKFHSSSCDEYGFGKGEYITTTQGDIVYFEAKTVNSDNENMVWSGTVQGDTIKGNYVWTKDGWLGKRTKTKEFQGSMKK